MSVFLELRAVLCYLKWVLSIWVCSVCENELSNTIVIAVLWGMCAVVE